jgi:ribosomal protein S27AE
MFGRGIFVLTVLETRQRIEASRERDFEMNRRFEEMTDLAERIGFPIETNIYYDLRGESLYARTDTKSRAFIEQTFQAREEARYMFTGDQAFEQTRRASEHQEAIDVERLAKGELSGNVMVKVSKVPDAIVDGRTSIKGYKRDTLRTFVRMYHRDGGTVRCKLFSIDHNNQIGLQRVGKLVGIKLTGRSSEDILADSSLFDVEDPEAFVEELTEQSIQSYDQAIHEQTGELTRGGSRFVSELDAQSAVESQPHLLSEHFAAISAIVGLGLNESAREDLFEIERQNTAAAISLAVRGYFVGSTGDAAVAAEVAQGNYTRECPTGSENAMQQGESDLTKDWIREVQQCPKCGQTKVIARKEGEVISGSCGCHLNVCTGKYWTTKPSKKDSKPVMPTQELGKQRLQDTSKDVLVKRAYGATAVLKTYVVFGGAHHDVIDNKSGVVIDTLKDIRQLVV